MSDDAVKVGPTHFRPLRIVGLMSGTSLDGLDAVLARFDGTPDALSWEIEAFDSAPYESDFRARLLSNLEAGGPEELCLLHTEIGERFADAVTRLLKEAGVDPSDVDLVGSHGQTVWHVPPSNGTRGSTLQLGDPATIAERTGIDVVSDFRARDMAAGGHGAPLVPMADRLLYSDPSERRALQNLGGIGNVTWLDRAGPEAAAVLAFDTGPGCGLVNAATELATGGRMPYDEDGALARGGSADSALVDRLLEHPYFGEEPPKSTGREVFGRPYVQSLAAELEIDDRARWQDLIASLTLFTARSMGQAYRRWVLPRGLDRVYLMGGGSRNPAMVDFIRAELPEVPVVDGSELGVNPDAREALAFAALAWAHVARIPGNEAEATGARGPRVLGSFTPGRDAVPQG